MSIIKGAFKLMTGHITEGGDEIFDTTVGYAKKGAAAMGKGIVKGVKHLASSAKKSMEEDEEYEEFESEDEEDE
ncbi:MAG: hypothetical protein J6X78_02300 [Treponema sp.]|nr:hypothetical protein [Treponema sp.]